MPKKQSGSSVEGRRREKSVKHIPDSQIDFSEVPELSEAELSKGKRVGRPKSSVVKQMIALRIDPALLSRLKKLAKKKKIPYQTLLHELLEEAVRDAA